MCSKVPYPSRQEAAADALLIYRAQRRFSRNCKGGKGRKLRPYHCSHCQQWHLTSKKPRKY